MKKTLKRTLCTALIPIIILSTFATALSALAAKETPLHNEQDSIDFSEMNMITFLSKSGSDFYSNRDYSEGGNSFLATSYLSSWAGPVSEESDPYDRSREEGDKYKKLKNEAYVDDVIHFDNSLSSVKSAVMEYGALYCGYSYTSETSSDGNYYTPSNYTPQEDVDWSYHAVAVVGWDDNYPKESFPIQPKNNGAIICKNSWGTYSGYDGYIYISYEDIIFDPLVIDYDSFVAFTVADPDCGYNKIYQYDEYGANGYFNKLYDKIDYAFNVFPEQGKTLSSDETLKAVSFHTMFSNTKYSVYLVEDYQKPEDAKLSAFNSKPVKIASGKAENPGYMVVDLDREYLLKAGTRFAIVLKIDYPVDFLECYAAEISYVKGVRGNRGESYYSSGNLIIDLYDSVENSNWSIKAFTNYKANDLMSQSNGKVNYFGIDNQNRKYSSSKVFSIEEIQELGGIISKDYIEYLKNPDGREIIPSPIDYVCETGFQKADTLPEKYDLRDYGYVSTVKDQGGLGSCWAHASLASLESNALKKFGSYGGVFKSYKTLEAREPYTVNISSPGARETFKFTSTGSGEYTFTFGSNAEGTLYSPFGIAFETGKQSITYYVAKGDTVFLTVGLSDRASTGSITVSADTEMLYDESSKIRIEAGDTVKAKTSSNSYSIYSIESSSYFDGFYKISCTEELEITVNGRIIEPNEYNEFEVYTNHKFYEGGDPETYNLLVLIKSPKSQEVEFEIETVEYGEYMCRDSSDIALNETVHIEHTDDDEYKTINAFRFVPSEKSGLYYAETDGEIYEYVFDSDKKQFYGEDNMPGVYYLEKGNEYYFCVNSYGSGDFSIVEYDGSSHHIELQENKPVNDKLLSLTACHEYSFTAKEEGYYRFVVQNISNFCHSILLNGNNPETIIVKSNAYIYTHFDEGERKTLEISCSKTEDEMYCFGDKYTVCVEKTEGTTLADDIPEISSGDTVQVSEMEPIYKFVCPRDGKLAFETALTCRENEIPDGMYMNIYNDEFDNSPFYDSTYITRLDLSTHIMSFDAEFEKGKTYYIVFYPGNASSFVFNIRERDYYDSTEQDTLTVDNSVSVISLNSPINVPVDIVSPESNEYGSKIYLYVESIYYYCSLDFEVEDEHLDFVCVERKESEHGTYISKWKLCCDEAIGKGTEIKGTVILYEAGDYKLRIEAEPCIPSNYIHLPETIPYKSTYKANAQGASKVIEWSSSNEDVAVIDENGLITAKSIGSTIITATFEDGSVATDTLYVKYAWWQMIIRILLLGFLWY